ncbi:MAG: TetR/AcrR family transcriptional regulator [Planctomycetota bacterium]
MSGKITRNPRLRTPGAGRDTKALLLEVSERLFAVHGPRNTPLRRIAEEAGVPLGAVRYHFGSKQGLFEAVVERCIEPAFQLRMASLDALEREHPSPTLAQAFEAYFGPVFDHATGDKGAQKSLLMLHGIYEHESYWPIVGRYFPRWSNRVVDLLARALPDTPRAEVQKRFNAVHLLVLMSLVPQTGNVDDPSMLPADMGERLRTYSMAILTAGIDHDAGTPR